MPEPIAEWNPARSVWETGQGQLCGHSDVFSETWPTAGMTRGGVAYALPMWAPRTPDIESSSLLKTPTAQLAINGGSQHPDKRKAGGHGPTLADEIEHLLPTPRATDGTKGGPNQRGSSGDLMLPSAVMLLPTPTATAYGSNQSPSPGAAVRPSLEGVTRLLPTPTTQDAGNNAGPSQYRRKTVPLNTAVHLLNGDRTSLRSADGKPSPDPLPIPESQELPASG